MDHTTFFFYLNGIEQQPIGPVVEHQQATVKFLLTNGGRNIVDVIDGLLNTGLGIHPIIGTDALKEPVDAIASEVLTAVKAHVFQKVGQSSLIVLFLQTTHSLRQIKASPVLRPVVIFNIIGKAIWQVPYPHC